MKPDRHMKAQDLFRDDTLQVFSVRTGNFIGYQRGVFELPFEDEQDPAPAQPEVKDENQLMLL